MCLATYARRVQPAPASAPEQQPVTFSAGAVLHFLGAAAGALWSIAAIVAYNRGLEPPSADPVGVARAVLLLPLLGAIGLRQFNMPVDLVTLVFALGILAGLLVSAFVRRRVSV